MGKDSLLSVNLMLLMVPDLLVAYCCWYWFKEDCFQYASIVAYDSASVEIQWEHPWFWFWPKDIACVDPREIGGWASWIWQCHMFHIFCPLIFDESIPLSVDPKFSDNQAAKSPAAFGSSLKDFDMFLLPFWLHNNQNHRNFETQQLVALYLQSSPTNTDRSARKNHHQPGQPANLKTKQ